MGITTKTDYAVIILTSLAKKPNRPVSLEFVSNKANVSEAYLQRIAALLKKAGLIKAKRGAFGGYLLKKPASEITLDKIVTAVGDSIHCVKCTNPKDSCPLSDECKHHNAWNNFQVKISQVFSDHTVADMIKD